MRNSGYFNVINIVIVKVYQHIPDESSYIATVMKQFMEEIM